MLSTGGEVEIGATCREFTNLEEIVGELNTKTQIFLSLPLRSTRILSSAFVFI